MSKVFPPPKAGERVILRNRPVALERAGCSNWWTPAEEIVARIMTQHWDLGACPCWVCKAGRRAGLGANWLFLSPAGDLRPDVKVGDE